MGDRAYRKLNLSDLDMVLQMEEDFRSGFVCEDNARAFLSSPTNWMFACIEDGRIIGFVYGYELSRLDDVGNMLYIHEIGVLPEFRRQGVGKRLLNNIRALCRLSGICCFFLYTEQSNQSACSFFESVGGEPARDDDVAYYFNLKS